MSASVGAVCVVAIFKFSVARLKSGTGSDSENLLKYLPHGRQWVELPALYLVQQASQLGIVRDSLLQMGLCPRRGDREHLAGEGLASALVEPPVRPGGRAGGEGLCPG